jgi:hypothetical protein
MVVRATEIIDSIQFLVVRLCARHSETPRRRTVNMPSSPSRRLAAASGWSALSSVVIAFVRSRPRAGLRAHARIAGGSDESLAPAQAQIAIRESCRTSKAGMCNMIDEDPTG